MRRTYRLAPTTQGPAYPPSEAMNADGDFVVVGRVLRADPGGEPDRVSSDWGAAIVSAQSPLPPLGTLLPYRVLREVPTPLSIRDADVELFTLPTPIPCCNYPMVFAPEQEPHPETVHRPSYPLNATPIPDVRDIDGPRRPPPITLGTWLRAEGVLDVEMAPGGAGTFTLTMSGLLPDSMYTVMSLRERDLDPAYLTRPGPLGVPNVFVTDAQGNGTYRATLPDPFPRHGNRVINVIVLWMSYQRNYGGAIGRFGLGGDIHAQLKLPGPSFQEFVNDAKESSSCPSSR